MALKHSYTLLAPFYDLLVSRPLNQARQKSLKRIGNVTGKKILINGIGTGLDLHYLPTDAIYTGTDITPAMLKLARERAIRYNFNIDLICADSHQLPFDDTSYDLIIMHLILAVVPRPEQALIEASRVLKPGGSIYIFDKFLKPAEFAPVRKLLNLISRHIATRTDVIFEDLLCQTPSLQLIHNEPTLANGWFRLIELRKLS
ncbi:MAG: class I SAM-dependent methyltransferase [Gammaproteobacteria bacterium]|nr:class I SAM-dependent methyltransferase [Gammaproteobacteria bacterium]